ncbi:MAG: sulfite exporter TauE/SafE family protein [Spirochaetota bacterium]
MLEYWWLFPLAGMGMGLIAGLFGVGGGVILVPFFTFVFQKASFGNTLSSQMAVATSMCCITFTSPSSMYAHHKKQGVDWRLVQRIVPGILLGSSAGAYCVSYLSGFTLKLIFLIFQFSIATWFLLQKKKTERQEEQNHITTIKAVLSGSFIGFFSALLGVGGGVFSTGFLSWHNYNIQKAIGTSAAIGFPLAVFASIGFIISGMQLDNLPKYSFGLIYFPALTILITSIVFAKIGASYTHTLDAQKLKKIFAFFLYLLVLKMIWSLL